MIEDDFDIKKKVDEVLEKTGTAEQRVAKMDVDELLTCVYSWFVLRYDSNATMQATLRFP